MSDLVEKVARAYYGTFIGRKPEDVIVDDEDMAAARAAIKCVAEWLNDEQGEPKNLIFQEAVNTLLSQLQEKSHE